MKPEGPLFDPNQFATAVSLQEQRERLSRSIEAVIAACQAGTVTQPVDFYANYSDALQNYRYGSEANAIPHARDIAESMHGFDGTQIRFAPAPYDTFEWQGMLAGIAGIAGSSYFALFEVADPPYSKRERKYDVLRLVNVPDGAVSAVDERGVYVVRRRDGGETGTFMIVNNPNYRKEINRGDSVVDDNDRVLMRQVIVDERRFIPLPLTPEQAIAAADELELAAHVYAQGTEPESESGEQA